MVNTAARLQSAAQSGQIVVSERLLDRVGSTPADTRPAALDLKGKSETVAARVIEAGSSAAAA